MDPKATGTPCCSCTASRKAAQRGDSHQQRAIGTIFRGSLTRFLSVAHGDRNAARPSGATGSIRSPGTSCPRSAPATSPPTWPPWSLERSAADRAARKEANVDLRPSAVPLSSRHPTRQMLCCAILDEHNANWAGVEGSWHWRRARAGDSRHAEALRPGAADPQLRSDQVKAPTQEHRERVADRFRQGRAGEQGHP